MGITCRILTSSTNAPLSNHITSSWIANISDVMTIQLCRDVAPFWGTAVSTVNYSDGTDIQPGEMVFAIVDDLPDEPGAVAYHDINGQDVPVAFLALSICQTLDDATIAISHELVETLGDIACNLWADDAQGHEYARELCDAVESQSYAIDGVLVSDFLLPAFFDPNGMTGALCFVQTQGRAGAGPIGPFQTAMGGYQIERLSGGGETQVTGIMSKTRKLRAAHYASRVRRRGVKALSLF